MFIIKTDGSYSIEYLIFITLQISSNPMDTASVQKPVSINQVEVPSSR